MTEASKREYFFDGFLIKHFGIWPVGIDKNNLFDEQRIFLVYLMGNVPNYDDWAVQINYQKELNEIETLKSVDISQSNIDLAKLHGTNIEDIKKKNLRQEKQKRIVEINKKYGVKEDAPPLKKVSEEKVLDEREELWELLQGNKKGLSGDKT